MNPELSKPVGIRRIDLLFILAFFAASLAVYPRNTAKLSPDLYYGVHPNVHGQRDNWIFDADCYTAMTNMADRWSSQVFNRRHPMFSVVSVPLTYAVSIVAPGNRMNAARLLFEGIACLWAPLMYLALAKLIRDRLAAAAFTLAGMFCAGSIFWLSIPERHAWASLTVSLTIYLLALARDRSDWKELLVGSAFFAALSMTVTNVLLAMLGGIRMLSWWKCAKAFYHAFAVMAIICTAASIYIPLSSFIGTIPADQTYTHRISAASTMQVAKNMFVHDYVAPRYSIVNDPSKYPFPVLSFESSGMFSTGAAGAWATGLWFAMIGLAVSGVFAAGKDPLIGFALPLYMAGQFVLHVAYGKETFLYAANSVPVMIALCASSARTRFRWPAIAIALAFAGAAWVNNTEQFAAVAAYTRALGGQ